MHTLNWFVLQIVTAGNGALVSNVSPTFVAICGHISLEVTMTVNKMKTMTAKPIKHVHRTLETYRYFLHFVAHC